MVSVRELPAEMTSKEVRLDQHATYMVACGTAPGGHFVGRCLPRGQTRAARNSCFELHRPAHPSRCGCAVGCVRMGAGRATTTATMADTAHHGASPDRISGLAHCWATLEHGREQCHPAGDGAITHGGMAGGDAAGKVHTSPVAGVGSWSGRGWMCGPGQRDRDRKSVV